MHQHTPLAVCLFTLLLQRGDQIHFISCLPLRSLRPTGEEELDCTQGYVLIRLISSGLSTALVDRPGTTGMGNRTGYDDPTMETGQVHFVITTSLPFIPSHHQRIDLLWGYRCHLPFNTSRHTNHILPSAVAVE